MASSSKQKQHIISGGYQRQRRDIMAAEKISGVTRGIAK